MSIKLTTTNELLEQLEGGQRSAIVALIDIKTEADMQAVLNKLDSIDARFESKFDTIESKFDAKFDAIESKFDAKFDALNSKVDNTRWFILGAIAIIGLLLKIAPIIN